MQRQKIDGIRSGAAQEQARGETVGGLLAGLLVRKAGRVEPATSTAYARACAYLEEGLGADTPLTALAGPAGAERVLAAYDRLGERLSGASLRRAHMTLRQALRYAQDEGRAVPSIPRHVRPPRKPGPPPRALPQEAVACFLEAAQRDDARWHALWTLAVCSGLRLGELLALEWTDLRVTPNGGGVVAVRRALSEDAKRRPQLRAYPKTAAGVRTVPIERVVLNLVLALPRLPTATGWGELVFPSPRTQEPIPQTSAAHAFARVWKLTGLPGRAHPHLLRHTFARDQLTALAPLPIVASRMGHGDAATTLRLYANFLRDDANAAPTPVATSYRIGAVPE
ncbi:MAG TPA: site-specific integrase [Chloroflexota bacterium]|nr:site-specific integrase [Chloroflexota bacterium]